MGIKYEKLPEIQKVAVLDYVEEKRLSYRGQWTLETHNALVEATAANRELVDYLMAGLMRGERRAMGGRRMFSKPYH